MSIYCKNKEEWLKIRAYLTYKYRQKHNIYGTPEDDWKSAEYEYDMLSKYLWRDFPNLNPIQEEIYD